MEKDGNANVPRSPSTKDFVLLKRLRLTAFVSFLFGMEAERFSDVLVVAGVVRLLLFKLFSWLKFCFKRVKLGRLIKKKQQHSI